MTNKTEIEELKKKLELLEKEKPKKSGTSENESDSLKEETIPDKEEKQPEDPKVTLGEILSNHETRLKEVEATLFRLRSI